MGGGGGDEERLVWGRGAWGFNELRGGFLPKESRRRGGVQWRCGRA